MKRLLVLAVLLAACSGAGTSTRTVDATEPPAPVATVASWPATYEDNVCSALIQLEGAADDLIELSAAAEDLDLERVSLMAYAAGGYFLGVEIALTDTPKWAPGDLLVQRLREIATEGMAATELIDAGTSEIDVDKVNRGVDRLNRATRLINSASAALDGLQRNRGFSC